MIKGKQLQQAASKNTNHQKTGDFLLVYFNNMIILAASIVNPGFLVFIALNMSHQNKKESVAHG